jgi:hypothetical protein
MGGKLIRVIRRIDEIVVLLESYVLGGVDLSERQVRVALRLLDLALDDTPPPPDDGDKEPVLVDADEQVVVVVFPPRLAA